MATNRLSVATISSPEFINIEGISPLVAKCEVKVLYLGGNRNGSYITKEVATQMAQTLPGCPIVGYFSENVDDFRDHGDQMIIDGDGIKFKCLTTPYGFIAPDARVWFQEFQDTDEFGNEILRTYLMTEGYLWVEQYKEAQRVLNEGRPQSMELDEKTLKGHWSTDVNRGIDFFIINDAIFSKLCILGEDVEPCFEGASVTAPNVSASFSKDEKFAHTLFTMMKELKELTLNNKGGKSMSENKEFVVLDSESAAVTPAPVVEEPKAEEVTAPVAEPEVKEEVKEENLEISLDEQGKVDLENNIENDSITEEFSKKSEEDEEQKKDDNSESKDGNANDDEEDDEKKKASKNSLDEKYALLEQQVTELEAKCATLEEENKNLLAFKLEVEDKEKDALIKSFYMLSDEDKKEVIENKSKFTLDDIEKELSVICVRKKVNFNLDEEKTTEKVVPTTFNLNEVEDSDLPAWLKAVEAKKNAENI